MAIDDVRLALPRPPPGRLTFEQFLEWTGDETRAEWVDGQVILLDMTVKERHEAIRAFLHTIFFWIGRLAHPGAVYGEPFLLWLPALQRGRVPDLFFVLDEHRGGLAEHYMRGPADIVVEIISPDSRTRDRVEKLAEYEQARIPEFWIVDDETHQAEFRVLNPDGRYRLAFAGGSGEFQSTVLPALRPKVEWLWQQPPGRDADDVLQMLGLR